MAKEGHVAMGNTRADFKKLTCIFEEKFRNLYSSAADTKRGAGT
jgi:hypothetical protein